MIHMTEDNPTGKKKAGDRYHEAKIGPAVFDGDGSRSKPWINGPYVYYDSDGRKTGGTLTLGECLEMHVRRELTG